MVHQSNIHLLAMKMGNNFSFIIRGCLQDGGAICLSSQNMPALCQAISLTCGVNFRLSRPGTCICSPFSLLSHRKSKCKHFLGMLYRKMVFSCKECLFVIFSVFYSQNILLAKPQRDILLIHMNEETASFKNQNNKNAKKPCAAV